MGRWYRFETELAGLLLASTIQLAACLRLIQEHVDVIAGKTGTLKP